MPLLPLKAGEMLDKSLILSEWHLLHLWGDIYISHITKILLALKLFFIVKSILLNAFT